MKKFLFILMTFALTLNTTAQKQGHHVIIPGKGNLDVEQFIRSIDTNMDISHLSLAELRILRNGFAARQGHIFMDATLRNIFEKTSWYDSLMWKRFEKEEEMPNYGYDENWEKYRHLPLKYTKEEQAFINKIQKREKELRQNLFNPRKGYKVDADKLINAFQLQSIDPKLKEALGKNGFAIVPGKKIQLFHVYEKNDYSVFPSFVTTDLYLQLFHLYFDSIVKDIEEEKLDSLVTLLCQTMYDNTKLLAETSPSKEIKSANAFNQAYFAVALALLTGEKTLAVAPQYEQQVNDEIQKVLRSEDAFSPFLGYNDVKYSYSLFRPRGHYSRNEKVQRYFRAMMWLQNVHFGTDKDFQLSCAAALADIICNNKQALHAYQQVFEPMTFIFGKPDNVTITQVYDEMKKTGLTTEKLLKSKKALKKLRTSIDLLGEKQTRIRPKFELTSHCKINFMPQRYMPDAEVLNEMIDAKNNPTKRGAPSSLDVFAAMGTPVAEQILLGNMHIAEQWDEFIPTLETMKKRMKEINWNETVATHWLRSLKEMTDTATNYPYFMQGDAWKLKDLNTALASYAELKHDAILYAKQPMSAECGGYGPPDPILKGYVEPNVKFWKRAIETCIAFQNILKKYDLMTEKATSTSEQLIEQAKFLLMISEKELAGKTLTDNEYSQIKIIGSTFEYISLNLAREKDQYLDGWDNVEGANKEISIVADIFTANGLNNPKKSLLYTATGPAYEIYVIVEIEDNLYLTRGAVFSYREFDRPLGEQRLTDEEWQQYLKSHPNYGIPSWMDTITIPLEKEPEDNEEFFYSSGC